MPKTRVKMRQVVDWSAAIWAGIIAGIVFLAFNMLLSAMTIGSPWVIIRLIASVLLGSRVLPPPATFDMIVFVVALVVHLGLSIGFVCLLAIVIHRWGLLVGISGGALFGVGLYMINFYTASLIFPWFFPMRSWMMALSHIVFGAVAGGFYEALEIEEFVPVHEQDRTEA